MGTLKKFLDSVQLRSLNAKSFCEHVFKTAQVKLLNNFFAHNDLSCPLSMLPVFQEVQRNVWAHFKDVKTVGAKSMQTFVETFGKQLLCQVDFKWIRIGSAAMATLVPGGGDESMPGEVAMLFGTGANLENFMQLRVQLLLELLHFFAANKPFAVAGLEVGKVDKLRTEINNLVQGDCLVAWDKPDLDDWIQWWTTFLNRLAVKDWDDFWKDSAPMIEEMVNARQLLKKRSKEGAADATDTSKTQIDGNGQEPAASASDAPADAALDENETTLEALMQDSLLDPLQATDYDEKVLEKWSEFYGPEQKWSALKMSAELLQDLLLSIKVATFKETTWGEHTDVGRSQLKLSRHNLKEMFIPKGTPLQECKTASLKLYLTGNISTTPSTTSLPIAHVQGHLLHIEPIGTAIGHEMNCAGWHVPSDCKESGKMYPTAILDKEKMKLNWLTPVTQKCFTSPRITPLHIWFNLYYVTFNVQNIPH